MDDSIVFFQQDTFSQDLGIRLIQGGEGISTMDLTISPRHLNSHGTVHGGVIFALADAAFAVASNAGGIPAVAINTSITYMKSASAGTLTASAREFSKNQKLGSYVVEIHDQDGEKIAVFQGLAYRKLPRR